MRGFLAGCVVVIAGSLATGCVLVERRPGALVGGRSSSPSCHPSQYWDGNQCRHKGQGHGARKHDGAPPGKGKKH